MRELDIVYVLKNGWKTAPQELRYSLRTVERNFPHRNVWFYGGQPKGFHPDGLDAFQQEGKDRYEKVRNTIARACRNEDLTEDFWLFNDDFFVLQPIEEEFCYDQGTIRQHVARLYRTHGFHSHYAKGLEKAENALVTAGKPTKDYTVHLPMLINREAALEALEAFSDAVGFRNIYGNYIEADSTTRRDVKISDIYGRPDSSWDFCSTSDGAFASGAAGAVICRTFPKASRWEIEA